MFNCYAHPSVSFVIILLWKGSICIITKIIFCVCVCVCGCQFFHLNYLFLHSDLNTLASSCYSFACCICNALSIIVCLFVNYLSAILLKLALSTNQSNTQSFLSWYSLFFLELRLLISPLENSKLSFIV